MKPETQALLSLIITSTTPILMLWMGFWVRKLEKSTNSKMDKLLQTTGDAEKAKGRLEGAAEQKLVSLKEHKEGAD
jgi:hypothetical protein